jgi:hypothetical protein
MMLDEMALERYRDSDELISLWNAPDVLILLPALSQVPLPRQQTHSVSAVWDTTTLLQHKTISGSDHE